MQPQNIFQHISGQTFPKSDTLSLYLIILNRFFFQVSIQSFLNHVNKYLASTTSHVKEFHSFVRHWVKTSLFCLFWTISPFPALPDVPYYLSWRWQWFNDPYRRPFLLLLVFQGIVFSHQFPCTQHCWFLEQKASTHHKIACLSSWVSNQESSIFQIQKCAQQWCVNSISHVSSRQKEFWRMGTAKCLEEDNPY